jgi:WD40 repeat protein
MQKYRFTLIGCCMAVMILTANACEQSGEKAEKPAVNTTTTRLAVIPDDYKAGEIVFSPDGRRVAYTAKKDGKSFVVADNKVGKPYEGVADLVFSPDSGKIAYRALISEEKMCIVADGREGAWYRNLGQPVFSPDGRSTGYEAMKGEKYLMVTGDRESPAFDMTYAPPLFSPDSTRIAYIEQHYDAGKNNVILCNADMTGRKRGKDYDLLRGITQSSSRSLLAYIAKKNKKHVAVIVDFSGKKFEEKEGSPYDDISAITLSPDGKHAAYIAKRSGKLFLVLDGTEQSYPADDVATQPLFSPNGKRSASVGIFGIQRSIVLDGKAGRRYDEIGRPVFSPDGRRIAYPAKKGQAWLMVVGQKEGTAAYDMIVTPQFSSDGSHLVYRARKDGKRFVVLADKDGRTVQEHPAYEMVWQPVFTPDEKSVAYGVKSGRELWWKVEPLK